MQFVRPVICRGKDSGAHCPAWQSRRREQQDGRDTATERGDTGAGQKVAGLHHLRAAGNRRAQAISAAAYDAWCSDGAQPHDTNTLRNCMQYMLDRNRSRPRGSLAPAVAPVRHSANGSKCSMARKPALDVGVCGIVPVHVSTVDEGAQRPPAVIRGGRALPSGRTARRRARGAAYWGLSQPEYYKGGRHQPLVPSESSS
jgi:hypothetical protein